MYHAAGARESCVPGIWCSGVVYMSQGAGARELCMFQAAGARKWLPP